MISQPTAHFGKKSKLVLGLLAIASAIGVGFYASSLFPGVRGQFVNVPASNPAASGLSTHTVSTDGWLTYTNSIYQFQFRFPPTWSSTVYLDNIGKPEGKPAYVIQQGVEIHAPQGPGAGLVYIDVFNNPTLLSTDRWLRDVYGPAVSPSELPNTIQGARIPSTANVSIAGRSAVRLDRPGAQSVATTLYYVAVKDRIYRVSLFLSTPELYDQVYAPLLNSLTFTP